jgi:flagellar biosynthesis protein FlhB
MDVERRRQSEWQQAQTQLAKKIFSTKFDLNFLKWILFFFFFCCCFWWLWM